jgi:hypothetical protein
VAAVKATKASGVPKVTLFAQRSQSRIGNPLLAAALNRAKPFSRPYLLGPVEIETSVKATAKGVGSEVKDGRLDFTVGGKTVYSVSLGKLGTLYETVQAFKSDARAATTQKREINGVTVTTHEFPGGFSLETERHGVTTEVKINFAKQEAELTATSTTHIGKQPVAFAITATVKQRGDERRAAPDPKPVRQPVHQPVTEPGIDYAPKYVRNEFPKPTTKPAPTGVPPLGVLVGVGAAGTASTVGAAAASDGLFDVLVELGLFAL